MAVSAVDVCNRALQKLGAARIAALAENSPNARDCNAAFTHLRDAELRAHPWNFARFRIQLAANATAPAFGFSNQFTLPADFLRPVLESSADSTGLGRRSSLTGRVGVDWQVESNADGELSILTNTADTLNLIYIRVVSDPNRFDPLFVESLAGRMAYELAEKITQSNSKKVAAKDMWKDAIAEARKANAFENQPMEAPEDNWVSERL